MLEEARMSIVEPRGLFPDKDPRIAGWSVVGNPIPIVTILTAYVYFVKVWGPYLMKNREPFEIRKLILLYNGSMVIANLTIALSVTYYAFFVNDYSVFLQPPDLSRKPATLILLKISWFYLMLRFSEFIETILFVLRKKYSQVSNLHVFHHISVAFCTWMYITYGGFALAVFETILNPCVHVVMYTYYFLSALGPEVAQYLWWKKYLTRIQLVQFIVIITRNFLLMFICGRQYWFMPAFMLSQCLIFFLQFAAFYAKAYKKKQKTEEVYAGSCQIDQNAASEPTVPTRQSLKQA